MALPKVSLVFLQAVIVVHFALTVWANQCNWLPESYQFCNFLVLGVGVSAVIASSNYEAAELFLFGMAFALLQDIIVIATFYKDEDTTFHTCHKKDHFNFSFAMSILNLIFKLGRGDGGLKEKVAKYHASRSAAAEPPDQALPPQQSPPPY